MKRWTFERVVARRFWSLGTISRELEQVAKMVTRGRLENALNGDQIGETMETSRDSIFLLQKRHARIDKNLSLEPASYRRRREEGARYSSLSLSLSLEKERDHLCVLSLSNRQSDLGAIFKVGSRRRRLASDQNLAPARSPRLSCDRTLLERESSCLSHKH